MDDMLELIKSFPNQIEEGYSLGEGVKLGPFKNIIVTGMGGSGLPSYLLKAYLSSNLLIFANRDYELPLIVDKDWLVVAISYSGNTEETLAAFEDARKRKCPILGITSGGKLHGLCRKYNYPYVLIPGKFPPRAAVGYLLFPLLRVLAENKVISNPAKDVKAAASFLKKSKIENDAIKLASRLKGKIPLIYASEKFGVIAYRWKTQFNENAKIHAFSHTFSEMNHNEIEGFESKLGEFMPVFLEDDKDNKRILKRMRIIKKLLEEKGYESVEIKFKGNSLLEKMCWGMHLGDLTSYYLAKEYGVDPAKVDLIENLKKELAK